MQNPRQNIIFFKCKAKTTSESTMNRFTRKAVKITIYLEHFYEPTTNKFSIILLFHERYDK
jgi:hypothetical protein